MSYIFEYVVIKKSTTFGFKALFYFILISVDYFRVKPQFYMNKPNPPTRTLYYGLITLKDMITNFSGDDMFNLHFSLSNIWLPSC